MHRVEHIQPYGHDLRSKKEQVQQMFDHIAPAYDFMNRAMTMGIDRLWRRQAVSCALSGNPHRILDIATGTGDLAIALARKSSDRTRITGVDLSSGMLEVGRRKVETAGLAHRISLIEGDCLALPMADETFDAVTVAYGVRNFQSISQGYSEIFRVLNPGGILVVLELSVPTAPIASHLYRLYTRTLVPWVGRLMSHDTRAYSYLPESIAAVPQRRDMTGLMIDAGFVNTGYRSLTMGVCTLYYAQKPL